MNPILQLFESNALVYLVHSTKAIIDKLQTHDCTLLHCTIGFSDELNNFQRNHFADKEEVTISTSLSQILKFCAELMSGIYFDTICPIMPTNYGPPSGLK